MTPSEFREALRCLHWTQRGFANVLETHPTTVRRWAMGQTEIPDHIAQWLHRHAAAMRSDPPPKIKSARQIRAA